MRGWRKQGGAPGIMHLELEAAMTILGEPTWPPTREIIMETRSSTWVAYFANGAQGSDPTPVIGYLAERIQCQGLVLTCRPVAVGKGRVMGAFQFIVFGPGQGYFANFKRSISVIVDGNKWRFEQAGSVLPFEDFTAYGARKVADRLTAKHLATYCRALLDDDAFEPTFYHGRAWMCDQPPL